MEIRVLDTKAPLGAAAAARAAGVLRGAIDRDRHTRAIAATILQRHPRATVYLDRDPASLLSKGARS
jgi:hypothetical protein